MLFYPQNAKADTNGFAGGIAVGRIATNGHQFIRIRVAKNHIITIRKAIGAASGIIAINSAIDAIGKGQLASQ